MRQIAGTALKVSALAAAVLLASCGGGGGGSDKSGGGSTPGAQREVQGTASKGLIKNAAVSVYALDADGNRSATAVATTTTASDGTYSVKIPQGVLNFVVEVTHAAGATMLDEATNSEIRVPANLKLRSVVNLESASEGVYTGMVTPLTEMVVRTAEKAGGGKLTPAVVSQTKTGITSLLGFNPEKVKPVNANDPSASSASALEKSQSLNLAAISQLAKDGKFGCGQTDPAERVLCVVEKVADSTTLSEDTVAINPESRTAIKDALTVVAENTSINRTGIDSALAVPSFAVDKVPAPANTGTAVQAAKNLFRSLRTTLQSVLNSDELTALENDIRADLDNAVAPLANGAIDFSVTATEAIEYLERYKADSSLPPSFYVSIDAVWSPCQVTSGSQGITASCDVVRHALPNQYSASGYISSRFIGRLVVSSASAADTYNYSVTPGKVVETVVFQPWSLQSNFTQVGTPKTGVITYVKSNGAITTLAIKGDMPGRLDGSGLAVSDKEVWALNATRTSEGSNLYKFAIDGSFSAIKGGVNVGTVKINSGSFARLALAADGDPVNHSSNEFLLSMSGISGDTRINGSLSAFATKTDKSGRFLPTKMTFTGSLENASKQVFSGEISVQRTGFENYDPRMDESATNFVRDVVGLKGKLSVPERPVLSLNVAVSRTSVDGGSVIAQYSDGTSVVNASVSAKVGERNPVISINSADGVSFEFSDRRSTVAVMKNDVKVALFNLDKGIVYYSDNTHESVK